MSRNSLTRPKRFRTPVPTGACAVLTSGAIAKVAPAQFPKRRPAAESSVSAIRGDRDASLIRATIQPISGKGPASASTHPTESMDSILVYARAGHDGIRMITERPAAVFFGRGKDWVNEQ